MGKRMIGLFSSMILLFSLLIIRLYVLTQSDYLLTAANNQSSYTIEIARTRGGIYDCKLNRLTDTKKGNIISVLPSDQSIAAVAKYVTGTARHTILEQMKDRLPFAARTEEKIYSQDIENFSVAERYSEKPIAPHIIGYLDGEDNGVSGIEKAYNEFLYNAGEKTTATYIVDAQRAPLEQEPPQISGTTQPPEKGVVLTIDKEIQTIAEEAAHSAPDMQEGAIVVMDVQTGELKAVVSVPEFNPLDIPAALEDSRSPLFNRAFAGYSVGSTFKLSVAAAALERGITTDFAVNCVGGIEVDKRIFYCHDRGGHQWVTMKEAVEQSCNPYFIKLGQATKAENIIYMAQAMGFGSGAIFAPGMESQSGYLPKVSEIQNRQDLANLSFGQGTLLATPVQIAQMVSSIANGGNAVLPSLVKGLTYTGNTIESQPEYALNRIMSKYTANTLKNFMISVVEEGSGTPGKPETGGAGGKTASAQTGKMDENGEEIVHAWFAGFFPAEEPKYATVVLVEGGEFGGKIASPIFKRIADQVNKLEEQG